MTKNFRKIKPNPVVLVISKSLRLLTVSRFGVGSTGQVHPRSAQNLANVAYHPRLTWSNNLVKSLEEQARAPMFGISPVELGFNR
jgi:cytochrome c peroxidase